MYKCMHYNPANIKEYAMLQQPWSWNLPTKWNEYWCRNLSLIGPIIYSASSQRSWPSYPLPTKTPQRGTVSVVSCQPLRFYPCFLVRYCLGNSTNQASTVLIHSTKSRHLTQQWCGIIQKAWTTLLHILLPITIGDVDLRQNITKHSSYRNVLMGPYFVVYR